jgi:isoleucyl-tRNA synthetase
MSKSKGNVVDPMVLMETYGSDIVRWYMYSVNQPGEAKRFSEKELVVLQRNVQMIFWNTANYFLTYASAAGWQPQEEEFQKQPENILDQWALARLSRLIQSVTDSLESLNIFRAARDLEDFVTELSTWYVRRSRGREDGEFFAILHHCILSVCRLLAPFMPFFAESVWQAVRIPQSAASVHLEDWPVAQPLSESERRVQVTMSEVRNLVESVLGWRKKNNIKVRQPLAELLIKASADWSPYIWVIAEELNFAKVSLTADSPGKQYVELLSPSGAHPTAYIDPELTEELRSQGLARELERQVQDLRKKSGLKVGERVVLHYDTTSQEVYEAFQYFDEGKTYVTRIIGARVATPHRSEALLNGHVVWIGIVRADT